MPSYVYDDLDAGETVISREDIERECDVPVLHRWADIFDDQANAIAAQLEASVAPGALADDRWRENATKALGWAKSAKRKIQKRLEALGEGGQKEEIGRLNEMLNRSQARANMFADGHAFKRVAREVLTSEVFTSIEEEVERRRA